MSKVGMTATVPRTPARSGQMRPASANKPSVSARPPTIHSSVIQRLLLFIIAHVTATKYPTSGRGEAGGGAAFIGQKLVPLMHYPQVLTLSTAASAVCIPYDAD